MRDHCDGARPRPCKRPVRTLARTAEAAAAPPPCTYKTIPDTPLGCRHTNSTINIHCGDEPSSHVGSGRASAVRADRCRTVSSHRPGEVAGSAQTGGSCWSVSGGVGLSGGFASRRPRVRIAHAPSPESPICKTSLRSVSTAGNTGASAVRADRRPRTVTALKRSRARVPQRADNRSARREDGRLLESVVLGGRSETR
jgi:hypothetical protein